MNKSDFNDWTLTKLDRRFGLTQIPTHPALDAWIQLSEERSLSDYEQTTLLRLKAEAIRDVDSWNEQEYSLNFIGPLFLLIDFAHTRFHAFAQRHLEGVVDGESISGKPDGIIARGRREPEAPYFCLQEYKRERDPEGDPAGQCLAAMMVAQELNQHQHPIYGCYVQGRNWFFMILQGKEYAISNSYTVTQDQIFDLFQILVELKKIIVKLVTPQKGSEKSNEQTTKHVVGRI